MMKQLILLFLLIPSIALSTPAITSVNGTVSHGQSITIAGSGFGTKSTAAPAIWDDCSGTTITTLWAGGWPETGTAAYRMQYQTPVRDVALPHSHITKYMTGAHGDYEGGYNGGYNVMVWTILTGVTYPTKLYASYYTQVDPFWPTATNGTDNNYKVFDFSNGDSPYTMNSSTDNNWYIDFQQSGTYPNTYINWSGPPSWEANDDGGSLDSHYWGTHGLTNPIGRWIKYEFEVKITDQSDGYLKAWDNGTLVINYTGHTDRYTGITKSIGLGGYARAYGENTFRYFADLYFDTTAQRVMICNGSSWAARGLCEVQIPSAWLTTSAAITVNQGSFGDGSTAYLYVVDADGNANSNGYQVTFSSLCPGQDVMIQGGSVYYNLIDAAYNEAISGQTILAQALTFNEDLNLGRNISITLKGGYSCGFNTNPGFTSVGSLIISAGSVTIENMVLE
jgi:hypothetical protein